MKFKLYFSKLLIESIKKTYSNAQNESMIVIWLKQHENQIFDTSFEIIANNNYIVQNKNSVMLNPNYLASIINTTINDSHSGFILMHNHLSVIPLLSPDDSFAHKKMSNFLLNKGINIIYGTAIYSNNLLSIKYNNKKIKRNYLTHIHKINLNSIE